MTYYLKPLKSLKETNDNLFKISSICCLLLINFHTNILFAQQITVAGKVTDTIQNPLAYANILAIPESNTEDIRFAITKDNCNFKLGLRKKRALNSKISIIEFEFWNVNIENPSLLRETRTNYLYYIKNM